MAKARTNDIAQAIYQATNDKSGAELTAVLENTARFLTYNRLLGQKEKIFTRLEEIQNEEDGLVIAKVTSKHTLSTDSKDEIKKFLTHHYKAKEIKLDEEKDESLIGGVKIEIGDDIINMSLKHQIDQLQNYLLTQYSYGKE